MTPLSPQQAREFLVAHKLHSDHVASLEDADAVTIANEFHESMFGTTTAQAGWDEEDEGDEGDDFEHDGSEEDDTEPPTFPGKVDDGEPARDEVSPPSDITPPSDVTPPSPQSPNDAPPQEAQGSPELVWVQSHAAQALRISLPSGPIVINPGSNQNIPKAEWETWVADGTQNPFPPGTFQII